MKKNYLIILILILIILGVGFGGYWLINKKQSGPANARPQQNTQQSKKSKQPKITNSLDNLDVSEEEKFKIMIATTANKFPEDIVISETKKQGDYFLVSSNLGDFKIYADTMRMEKVE